MEYLLPYGRKKLSLHLPEKHVLGVLEPKETRKLESLEKTVEEKIALPDRGASLEELLRAKKPRSVAIIVNDLTRSTPTAKMLPPVLNVLSRQGVERKNVTIVIATGTHRGLTEEEKAQVVGSEVLASCRVENHDCDAPDLVSLGNLSTGNELRVNPLVAKAEFRIALGEVLLHYYAGFAGGRKSILPGVSGRDTVMRNHAMMVHPKASLARIEDNPLSMEMVESLTLCPLDFIVNCIANSHKEIVAVVAGDAKEAWKRGTEIFYEVNSLPLKEKADVLFVSAGGFPKDINMYQAHKAVEISSRALKEGGSLVLFAELEESYGHPVYEEWAKKGLSPAEVEEAMKEGIVFGAHKLFFLGRLSRHFSLHLYSSQDEAFAKKSFFSPVASLEALLSLLEEKHGPDYRSYVIPQGGIVLPLAEDA